MSVLLSELLDDVLKNLAYRNPAVSMFLWIIARTTSVCRGAQTAKGSYHC